MIVNKWYANLSLSFYLFFFFQWVIFPFLWPQGDFVPFARENSSRFYRQWMANSGPFWAAILQRKRNELIFSKVLFKPKVPSGCEIGAASNSVSQSTVGRSEPDRWRPRSECFESRVKSQTFFKIFSLLFVQWWDVSIGWWEWEIMTDDLSQSHYN